MCGRFTLTSDDRGWLAAELGVDPASLEELSEVVHPRFNIAPTQPHWIVRALREDRVASAATWGLVTHPDRAREAARFINARAEDAERRPLYRDTFRERRCVVPADGFFEWVAGPAAARRPFWFHRPAGGLLRFAGLYAPEGAGGPGAPATFTILTTAANETVSPVHDRMPAILADDGAAEAWLRAADARELRALLAPVPGAYLVARAVSPRVNHVSNDDPACLAEVDRAVQSRLL